MIVNHTAPLTLIGGGDVGERDLDRALRIGDTVVAADSGADVAVACGIHPSAVIGDFDSISEAARAMLQEETLHHFNDQDSTDFEKCLRNITAPLIVGIGFCGARIDHQLANLNALVRFPTQRCILMGRRDIAFLAPPSFSLDTPNDTPVSLFPLGAVEGISEGLEWPITGLNFHPDGQIGTSNKAKGPIFLSFTSPKMILILPEKMLEAAADALRFAGAGWA